MFTKTWIRVVCLLALLTTLFVGAGSIPVASASQEYQDSKALGDTGSKNLPHFQVEVKANEDQPERIQLKCPALIDKSKGVMKVGIKELTTNGAFVTCPNPFPVGESFPIRILLDAHDPQTFNAEVVWNNQNVIEEEIVTRGMKVRFLKLSASDRKTINEIITLGWQSKALP